MRRKPLDVLLSEVVVVRFTAEEIRRLDVMVTEGEHGGLGPLIRSLVRTILDDDAAAHGEPPIKGRALNA